MVLASCATIMLAVGMAWASESEGPDETMSMANLRHADVYLDVGGGFHRNDVRVAVLRKDQDVDPLAPAVGHEAGIRTHRWHRLELATAAWLIDLDEKLSEVGGAFESGGPNRRWGIDFQARYHAARWLAVGYDVAYGLPHAKNGDPPLAPTLLMTGGLTIEPVSGLSLGVRARYVDDRRANVRGSSASPGYFLLDLAGEYRWRNVEASIQLLNLTNADRSAARVASQEDVRFTTRNPFGFIAGIEIAF
jgi:TonB-dependent receptor-like protein